MTRGPRIDGPELDELIDMAVGVLGESIDSEGTGWDGQPWFVLVTVDGDDETLFAFAPRADDTRGQLVEVVETFRDELPVACAYVKRARVVLDGEPSGTTVAVLQALDGRGSERTVLCEVLLMDDGRESFLPYDDVDVGVLSGTFESVVADALMVSRAARADTAASDSRRWDALLERARACVEPPRENEGGRGR